MLRSSFHVFSALLVLSCSKGTPESTLPPVPDGQIPFVPLAQGDDLSDEFEGVEIAAPHEAVSAPKDAPVPAPEREEKQAVQPAAKEPAKSTPKTTPRAVLELPVAAPKSLERRASCDRPVCQLDGYLPDPAFAKSLQGADSPGAMWLHEIKAKSSVMFPRHKSIDISAVVLSGDVVMTSDDAKEMRRAGPWGAVFAPGGGVLLRAQQSDASVVVLVSTSQAALGDALGQAKAQAWQVRWQKRPAPGSLKGASLKSAEGFAWGGGAFSARIAFGGEGPQAMAASLQLLQAKAGSTIPEHEHPSWEHIAILDGRGRFQLGDKEYAVEPGKIFHIPKGVKHSFRGAGGVPVLAIQSYTPSGEEQRFVKLSKGGP